MELGQKNTAIENFHDGIYCMLYYAQLTLSLPNLITLAPQSSASLPSS